jgi:hypothetical protein
VDQTAKYGRIRTPAVVKNPRHARITGEENFDDHPQSEKQKTLNEKTFLILPKYFLS